MSAFSGRASAGSAPHACLALALAAELHDVDARASEDALRALAGAMARVRDAAPLEQLAHCGRVTGARIVARVSPAATGDLLLDRVLAAGTGDPVAWAIACVEAARRAGIPLGIVADEEEHCLVAHRRIAEPLVVEPLAPEAPLDARRLPAGDLTWRCSHETALMLLDRLVVRAARTGRLADALRAADLRLELPLHAATRSALRAEREALAARLN